ncbi:hypothetical protein K7957_05025 [Sphingomonas yunnanensis]|uniref:hypothetical protein n=1 Tax=Sphingomonas yunnanensis TaxID=310400 RepID=UPI001CA79B49|nr:hypothetical protein [Sphingomonas yunnanensis]MBY9062291.1 hypothetical protein [Sphingomonas yunnanensis]
MTDTDRHWRYVLATMLILAVAGIAVLVAYRTVPEASQRLLDTLAGGLIGAMTLAVQKAIDGARAAADAVTIERQSAQLADSRPADVPTGRPGDPVAVTEEPR